MFILDKGIIFVAGLGLIFATYGLGQQQTVSPLSQEKSLKRFMSHYLDDPAKQDGTSQYSYAFVDLNDDGVQEAVVYLSGDGWCGSDRKSVV